MQPPSRRAEQCSANVASPLHSSLHRRRGRASCGFLQRGRSTHRRRELTAVLRSRFHRFTGGKTVQHRAEVFLVQILVGILPDQYHWRVHAGAKTLDLFPTEISVLGQMEGFVMNAALAHLDDIAGAAQPAWRVPQTWTCA